MKQGSITLLSFSFIDCQVNFSIVIINKNKFSKYNIDMFRKNTSTYVLEIFLN